MNRHTDGFFNKNLKLNLSCDKSTSLLKFKLRAWVNAACFQKTETKLRNLPKVPQPVAIARDPGRTS